MHNYSQLRITRILRIIFPQRIKRIKRIIRHREALLQSEATKRIIFLQRITLIKRIILNYELHELYELFLHNGLYELNEFRQHIYASYIK